jgi:hypothetical protein
MKKESPMPTKQRHVLAVVVAALLGSVLMSFQNCSQGIGANQAFQNDIVAGDRKSPEFLDDMKSEENAMAMQATKINCASSDIKFRWPLNGVPFKDWVVLNYVDANQTPGVIRDYMGNSHTNDQHQGIDIDNPNFRLMDADFPVLAAANGTVIEVVHNYSDRNRACVPNENNYVKIQHINGIRTIYAHLKRNSVVVSVGQQVTAGQKLGVIGSSGCSTYPHLHFEVVECNGGMWDPIALNMFQSAPPVYTPNGPTTIMDSVVKQPKITSVESMVDPGADPASVKKGTPFSVGVTLSTFKANGVVKMNLFKPDGSAFTSQTFQHSTATYRAMSHWYWNINPGITGEWTAKFSVNGVAKGERKFNVVP